MKKFLITAPLALAIGAVLTTPASAANVNSPSQIRTEINQLDRQVDRARGLSRSEEKRLDRQIDQIQKLYRTYARNGLNRGEISILNTRIDMVRNQLFKLSYNGNHRNDRNDRSNGRKYR